MKILKKIKNFFKKEKTHSGFLKRNNNNFCYYCGDLIGDKRFSFSAGHHFHKSCVKKWYKNKRRRLEGGRQAYKK